MPTIFIDLPHNKGSFKVELKNDRQEIIINEFLNIVEENNFDIDKQDLDNIVHISSL